MWFLRNYLYLNCYLWFYYDIFGPKYIIMVSIYNSLMLYYDIFGALCTALLLIWAVFNLLWVECFPWDYANFVVEEIMCSLLRNFCISFSFLLHFRENTTISCLNKPILIIPRTSAGSENRVMAFRGDFPWD